MFSCSSQISLLRSIFFLERGRHCKRWNIQGKFQEEMTYSILFTYLFIILQTRSLNDTNIRGFFTPYKVTTFYFWKSVCLQAFLYVVFLFLNITPEVHLAPFHFSSPIIIFFSQRLLYLLSSRAELYPHVTTGFQNSLFKWVGKFQLKCV